MKHYTREQHTRPNPLYKIEPVLQHIHNIQIVRLMDNRHNKSKYIFNHINNIKIKNIPWREILTQFIITHYRDNTCSKEGETALTLFRNIINTKTPIAVALRAQQFPNFKAPDDGRVGRNV
jgi:hypothetical protein